MLPRDGLAFLSPLHCVLLYVYVWLPSADSAALLGRVPTQRFFIPRRTFTKFVVETSTTTEMAASTCYHVAPGLAPCRAERQHTEIRPTSTGEALIRGSATAFAYEDDSTSEGNKRLTELLSPSTDSSWDLLDSTLLVTSNGPVALDSREDPGESHLRYVDVHGTTPARKPANWGFFYGLHMETTVTRVLSVQVTKRVLDPGSTVTLLVSGCRPSVLSFDVPLCDESVSGDIVYTPADRIALQPSMLNVAESEENEESLGIVATESFSITPTTRQPVPMEESVANDSLNDEMNVVLLVSTSVSGIVMPDDEQENLGWHDVTKASSYHSVATKDVAQETSQHTIATMDLNETSFLHTVASKDVTETNSFNIVATKNATEPTLKRIVETKDLTKTLILQTVATHDVEEAPAKNTTVTNNETVAALQHIVSTTDVEDASLQLIVVTKDVTESSLQHDVAMKLPSRQMNASNATQDTTEVTPHHAVVTKAEPLPATVTSGTSNTPVRFILTSSFETEQLEHLTHTYITDMSVDDFIDGEELVTSTVASALPHNDSASIGEYSEIGPAILEPEQSTKRRKTGVTSTTPRYDEQLLVLEDADERRIRDTVVTTVQKLMAVYDESGVIGGTHEGSNNHVQNHQEDQMVVNMHEDALQQIEGLQAAAVPTADSNTHVAPWSTDTLPAVTMETAVPPQPHRALPPTSPHTA